MRRLELDGDGITANSAIATVLGEGSASSAGEGWPAWSFPVGSPRGLSVDGFGSLLVTSTRALRLVAATGGPLPTGADPVFTLFGDLPLDPLEVSTGCLTDCQARAAGDQILCLDGCTGALLQLSRDD